MVNLDKWEKVEHDQVRVGDRLKIVVTEKGLSPVLTTEVYKGRVTSTSRGLDNREFYLSDGSVWEDVDATAVGETTTVYRRKVSYTKPFKLPTELGAVISGRRKHELDPARIFLVFDGADWSSAYNSHNPSTIEERFTDLRLERKGIKQ